MPGPTSPAGVVIRGRARLVGGNVHLGRGPMKDGMTPPTMGITHARVVLYSIDMARNEACDLLLDTGSTLSWVPEEVAARVGIQATEDRTSRLAGGRRGDRTVGEAILA